MPEASLPSDEPRRLWLWIEGKGDGAAAQVLVRRILYNHVQAYTWQVVRPIRVGRWDQFLREVRRFVEHLRRRQGTKERVDAVLVLLDLDDGCAAEVASTLAQALWRERPPVPMAVVLAVREFEAWFLASARSLWGTPHPNPEGKRDAKGEVRRYEREYAPTTHQAALSARLDLQEAADNSRSFRRLLHAVEELVHARGPFVTPNPKPD